MQRKSSLNLENNVFHWKTWTVTPQAAPSHSDFLVRHLLIRTHSKGKLHPSFLIIFPRAIMPIMRALSCAETCSLTCSSTWQICNTNWISWSLSIPPRRNFPHHKYGKQQLSVFQCTCCRTPLIEDLNVNKLCHDLNLHQQRRLVRWVLSCTT